jgi:hypothetical protein
LNRSICHDEGLQRTNPGFVLQAIARDLDGCFARNWHAASSQLADAVDKLTSAGIPVPPCALDPVKAYLPVGFTSPPGSGRPGVLGLVVLIGSNDGFVLPLSCRLAGTGWDESLPFGRESVLDILVQLVAAAGLPTGGVLPERLQFAFGNPLGHGIAGNSMTVAAALSVLDALGEHRSDLLRCACAVVQPAEGGQLRSVDHMKAKLQAVIRELGGGSLLVCAPECEQVNDVRSYFDVVWEVRSFEELAAKLHDVEILDALFQKIPLRWDELERVLEHLRVLVQTHHRYQKASDLGRRLLDCSTMGPIPVSLWNSIRALVAQSHRHQGNFQEAYLRWKDVHGQVHARGHLTSYDERADTAAEFAATLFDCHRFGEIPPVLEIWIEVIRDDPQKLAPQTRIKVLNTLARARVILGQAGWDELFRRSLEIQERLDHAGMLRTKCYWIHGMLRQGRYDCARNAFDEMEPLGQISGFSGWQLRYLRADLARRIGETWEDPELEQVRPGSARPGHPIAWYLQARGRQLSSSTAHDHRKQACKYFQRAAEFLRDDAQGQPQNICTLFASCFELHAASLVESAGGWTRSANEIRRFLDAQAAEPLRDHYSTALAQFSDSPSRPAAEHLLSLIPYL